MYIDCSDSHPRFPKVAGFEHQGRRYHVQCLGQLPFGNIGRHFRAMKRTYPPSIAHEEKTNRFLKSAYSVILENALPSLPGEICLKIAEAMPVRELGWLRVRLAAAAWQAGPEETVGLSLTSRIVGRYVYMEGEKYLAHLENGPGSSSPSEKDMEILFDPQLSPRIDSICIAKDHLGVRELLFVDSEHPPHVPAVPDLWWNKLVIQDREATIGFEFDVSQPVKEKIGQGHSLIAQLAFLTNTTRGSRYERSLSLGSCKSRGHGVSFDGLRRSPCLCRPPVLVSWVIGIRCRMAGIWRWSG